MADNQHLYYKKFNEMQETYIPFLEQMISKLKKSSDNKVRQAHLENLQSLHSLLTNPNKKLKLEILEKSEKVLLKLSEIFDKNEPLQRDQAINKSVDCVKNNDESLQMNSINLKLAAARVKLSKTCELPPPASPSPPPILEQVRRPAPILIPTERKEERRTTPIIIPTERKEPYKPERLTWAYNVDNTKNKISNDESSLFNRSRLDKSHDNYFHNEKLFQRRQRNILSPDESQTEKSSNKYLDLDKSSIISKINFSVQRRSVYDRLGEKVTTSNSSSVILSPPPIDPPLSLEDIEDLLSDSSENRHQNSDSEIKRLETLRQQIVNEIENLSDDKQENEEKEYVEKNKTNDTKDMPCNNEKCEKKQLKSLVSKKQINSTDDKKKNIKPPERIIKESDNIFGSLLSSIDDQLFEGLKKKDSKKNDKEKKETIKSGSVKLKSNENKNNTKSKEEKSLLDTKKSNVQLNKNLNITKKLEPKDMCKEDRCSSTDKINKSNKINIEAAVKSKNEKGEKERRIDKKDRDKNISKTNKSEVGKETDKNTQCNDNKKADISSKDKKHNELSKNISSDKQEMFDTKSNEFKEILPEHKIEIKMKTDKLLQNINKKDDQSNIEKNKILDSEKNSDQCIQKENFNNVVVNVENINESNVKKNLSVNKQKDEIKQMKKEIVVCKENETEKSIVSNAPNARICNNLGDKDERVYIRLADKYNPHPRRNSDNEKTSKSIDSSPSFNVTGRGLTMREIERFSQGANTHDDTLVSPTPSNDSNTSHGSSQGINSNDPRVKKTSLSLLPIQSPNIPQRIEEQQLMFEHRFRQEFGNRPMGPTHFNPQAPFETQNQFYNGPPRMDQGNFNRFPIFHQNFQGNINPQIPNSYSGCMTPQDPFSPDSYGNVGMQNQFDRRTFRNLNQQMNMQNVPNNQNVFHKNISQIQYDLTQIGPIDYFEGNQQHFYNEVGPKPFTNSNNLVYGNASQNPTIIQNTNRMQNSNMIQHNANSMQNNLQRQISDMSFNPNIPKSLMSLPFSSTLPPRPYGRGPPPHTIPSLFSVKPIIETNQIEPVPRTYAEHRNRREFTTTKSDQHILENSFPENDVKNKVTEKRFRGYDPRPTPRPKKIETGPTIEESCKNFKIPKLKKSDDVEDDQNKDQSSDDVHQLEEINTEVSEQIEVIDNKKEEKACDNVKHFDDSTQNPEITSNTNDSVETTANEIIQEIKKEDLVNDFIKKLCESGNTNVFFEVLEKLGETFTSKKYKRIQKIMQSDSEESSGEDEKLSEIKTKQATKKKEEQKEKAKDSIHNNEDKRSLETKTLFETVGERIKIGRTRRNQSKNICTEDEKEFETSNNENKNFEKSICSDHDQSTDLDVSSEEIRDIFICDGVLTTTGKKMCKLLKDSNEHIEIQEGDDKKDSIPITRSCKSSMSEALTALVDIPKKRTRLPRVVLEKTDLTKLQKSTVSEPDNFVDETKGMLKLRVRKGGKQAKIIKQSKKRKTKGEKNQINEVESIIEQGITLDKSLVPVFINRNLKMCIHLSLTRKFRRGKILKSKINDVIKKLSCNIDENEVAIKVIKEKNEKNNIKTSKKSILKNKTIGKKRGKKKGWKAGVIKKKLKKKSTQLPKKKILDSDVIKNLQIDKNEIKFSTETKDVNLLPVENTIPTQDIDHEASVEKLNFNENSNKNNYVDKNYCYIGLQKYNCKLCKFNGKTIVLHYTMSHPNSEVLISRLTESVADICVKQSIEKDYDNYEQEEELLNCIEYRRKRFVGFICRFCNVLIKNEFTETFFDHLTTHTGEYRYSCFQCSSVASTRPSIRAHIGQKHPDQKNRPAKILYESSKNVPIVFGYLCNACNFTQMQKSNIKKHIKTYHSDEEVHIYKINLSSIGNEVVSGDKEDISSKNNNIQETSNESCSEICEEKSEILNKNNKNELSDIAIQIDLLEMSKIEDTAKKTEKNIPSESKRDESHKEPDMTVFMCTEEIEEDEQKIQEERLKKMEQIIETIGKPRRSTINFVDKLKSKLASVTNITSEENINPLDVNIKGKSQSELDLLNYSNQINVNQKLKSDTIKEDTVLNYKNSIESIKQKSVQTKEESVKSNSLITTKVTTILETNNIKNEATPSLCESSISRNNSECKISMKEKDCLELTSDIATEKQSIKATFQKVEEKSKTHQREIIEITSDIRKIKQNDPSNWKAKKSKTAILDTIQRLANVVKQNKIEEQIIETDKNILNSSPLVHLNSASSKDTSPSNSLIVTVGTVSARKTKLGILYYCTDNHCCFSSENDSEFLKHIQSQHSTEFWDGECLQCDIVIKSFSGKTTKQDAYNHLILVHLHSLYLCPNVNIHKNSSNVLMSATNDVSVEKDHESSLPASLPKKPLIRMRRLSGDILSKPIIKNTSLDFTNVSDDIFEGDIQSKSKNVLSGGSIIFQKNENSNIKNDFKQSDNIVSIDNHISSTKHYQPSVNEYLPPIVNDNISAPSAIQICDVRSLSVENDELNPPIGNIQTINNNNTNSNTSMVYNISPLCVETENINSEIPQSQSFNSVSKSCKSDNITKLNTISDGMSSMLSSTPTSSTYVTITAPNFKTQIPVVLDKQLMLHPPKDLKLLSETTTNKSDNTCMSDQVDIKKNLTSSKYRQSSSTSSKSSIYVGNKAELEDPEVLPQMLTAEKLCNLFKCMIRTCGFTTDCQPEFIWHLNNEHNINKSQEKDKAWSTCPYCGEYDFKKVSSYIKHILEEHGECRYQCAYCLYRTAAQTLIELHEKKEHTNQRLVAYKLKERSDINPYRKQMPLDKICLPYVCTKERCRMKFYTCDSFIDHLTNGHPGLSEFACIYCHEKHPNPSALLKHYLVHNMGLIQCVYCHYSSRYISAARSHMYLCHPNQPAKVLIREVNPVFRTNRQHISDNSDILYDLHIRDLELNDYAMNESVDLPKSACASSKHSTLETIELDYQSNQSKSSSESIIDPIDVVVISDDAEEVIDDSPSITQISKNVLESNTDYNNKTEDCDEPLVLLRHRNPQTTEIIENAVDPLGAIDAEILSVVPLVDNEEINSENIIIKDITAITSPTIDPEEDPSTSDKIISSENFEHDDKNCTKEIKMLSDIDRTGLSGHKLYKCGAKGCSFFAENLSMFRDHLFVCDITEDLMMFTCYHCKKRMKHMNSFIDHIITHGTYRYGCSLCSHRGTASSYVSKHLKAKHKVSCTRTIPLNPLKTNHELDLFVVCPFRKGVQFKKNKNSLNLSSKLSATQNINLEDKVIFSPEEINLLPRKPIFPKEVRCSKCSYATKVRSNMIRHLGAHLNDTAVADSAPVNPVPCLNKNEKMFDKMVNLANSSFTTERKTLSAEEKAKLPVFVPEHKRFVCGVKGCSYLTINEMMLRCHFQALHNEETEYKCPHCTDEDPTPANIDKICAHLRMHESKLYKCVHCQYHHYQKHIVERHLSERHEGKAFFVHIIRESENGESQIERSTGSTAVLTSINISENIESTKDFKPWCCGLCKFKTTNRNNVIDHAQANHGVRSQYKCSLCSFKCSYDKNFQGHFDSKHPGQKVEMISVYYKEDGSIRSTQQPIEISTPVESEMFDTTPLWKRDMPRIRHIRGILFDEVKTTPKKSLKTTLDVCSPTSSTESLTKNTKIYKKRSKSTSSAIIIDELSSNSTDSNSKSLDIIEKISPPPSSTKLQYVCPMCSKFRTKIENDFIDHLFRELKYDRFVCTHCKMTSYSYDVLKKHSEKMHNKQWQPEAIVSITPDKNIENQILTILQEQRKRLKPNLEESITDLDEIMKKNLEQSVNMSAVTRKMDFNETNIVSSDIITEHNVEDDTDDEILIIDESEESLAGINETFKLNETDEEIRSVNKNYTSTSYQCGYCNFIASTSVDVIKHSVNAHIGKEPVLNQKVGMQQNLSCNINKMKKPSSRKRKSIEGSDLHGPPTKKMFDLKNDTVLCNAEKFNSDETQNTSSSREDGKKIMMYMCQFCPKRGESIEEIFNHWKLIHKDVKSNTLRSRIFKYKTVTNEEVVERGRTICMLCGFRGKKSTLKNHHATAHVDQKPHFSMSSIIPFKSNIKIKCKLCDYCAYDLDFIKKHFQLNHSTENFENLYQEDIESLNQLQRFKCCYCHEIVQDEKKDHHHNLYHSHLSKRFDACSKVIRFGCPECNHSCNSYSSILDHIRKHAKPFKCSHCDVTFRFPSKVKHHFVREHADLPTNYICLKKPKQFLANLREKIECLFDDGTKYLFGEAKNRKNKKALTGYDSTGFQKNKTSKEEIRNEKKQTVLEPVTSLIQSTLPVTLPTKRSQVAKKSTTLLPNHNLDLFNSTIKNNSLHQKSLDLNTEKEKKEEEGYSYYGTKPDTDYTNITTVMQLGSAHMKVNISTLVQLMNIFPKVVVKDLKHKKTCL